MSNEQETNKESNITDYIGIINSGASGAADEWIRNNKSNIPKGGGSVLRSPFWVNDGMLLNHNLSKAKNEMEAFKEKYKWLLGAVGAHLGGHIGKGCMLFPYTAILTPACVGLGAAGGNWLGNEFAEFSSDFVYDFIQAIQSIGTTNPRLTLADIKLVEALFDQYTQKDSTQSNRQDRISCLQPTISQAPNLANKNISTSFKSAISSKVTQTPKDETLNLKN